MPEPRQDRADADQRLPYEPLIIASAGDFATQTRDYSGDNWEAVTWRGGR